MINFSIIICSYNPDNSILNRLLNSIQSFGVETLSNTEVIIVDNNSANRLSDNADVKNFLDNVPDSYIIVEKTPGLTSARLSGIAKAKYDWLIFFDDDNEPAENYIEVLEQAINEYPQTGAWGPGHIEVEFTESDQPWLQSKKNYFQQRNEPVTIFQNDTSGWLDCYPFGTGLCIKKKIADSYSQRVKNGDYTLTDRTGKSLSSGGDVQMVLTGIQSGSFAGVIKDLKLNHLINAYKANIKYLVKQQYGTASAYVLAYNQVFTDKAIRVKKTTNFEILLKVYSLFRIHRSKMSSKDFRLFTASKLGEVNAVFVWLNCKKPLLLLIYERLINY